MSSPDSKMGTRTIPGRAFGLYRGAVLLIFLLAWALLIFRLNEVPPGFQHDQMFDAQDALDVLRGHGQLYFPANFGREPLFMYAAAGVFAALAQQHLVWGLRFTGVLWAMLGLAVMMCCARRYLPRWAVPVAGAGMAGSFWFLFAGRLGLEPIPLIALAMGMIYFLDRGLTRVRQSSALMDFVLAGILGGLAAYTYLAGRTLFALVPMLLIYELTARVWRRMRRRASFPDGVIPGLVLSLLTMAVISAPLLIYVSSHTNVADRRVGEVGKSLGAALQGDPAGLLNNVRETLLSIVWAGTLSLPYQYNLPGRPALQPVWAIMFALGLVISLTRIFRRGTVNDSGWPARRHELLFLTTLVIGLAPNLITGADALHMRGIIALPLIFVFAASGLWAFGRLLARLWPAQSVSLARPALVALVALLLALQLVANADAYFRLWAEAEPTQRIYNADFRAVAAYLDRQPGDEPVFIGTDRLIDLDSQTYQFYEPHRTGVHWFQLPDNPPLPAHGSALYLLPTSTERPAALAALGAIERDRLVLPASSGNLDLMQGFRLNADDIAKTLRGWGAQPLADPITFGDSLRLDVAGLRHGNGTAELVTAWTIVGPWPRAARPGFPPAVPKMSVALVDDSGYKWAQADVEASFPFMTWQPGQRVLELTPLTLPPDLPPANYTVRLGMYDDEQGPLAMRQGAVPVADPPVVASEQLGPQLTATAPMPPYPVQGGSATSHLQPLGAWEHPQQLIVGLPATIHISWQAPVTVATESLTFPVRAYAADGKLVWQQTASVSQALPSSWPAGQILRLSHRLLPQMSDAAPTEAKIEVCAAQQGKSEACASLGPMRITAHHPLLALPRAPQHASGAEWSAGLTLAGYDAIQDSAAISLTLYWQTKTPPPATLKRFVHGEDAAGKILAQVDSVPDNGGIPMPDWRAGEYVVDRVVLQEQAGTPIRNLYVGLYDPETGKRASVRSPSGAALPDDRQPLELESSVK
jgi:hypothetical protein